MSKFKVGDKVKVVYPMMPTNYVEGDTGVVVGVSVYGGLEVEFPSSNASWFLFPGEVELVEEGVNDVLRDENGYEYKFTEDAVHVTPKQIEAEVNAAFSRHDQMFRRAVDEVKQAKRYSEGKAPLSYILLWPKAIEALANVCRKGEEKYDKFNYKKGAPVSQYMDSGLRHQKAFVNGEDLDPEDNCYHLAKDIWNKMQALEVMLTPEMKERFDDRYRP